MSFSEVARSYDETKKRTSAEYVKFDPKYRVVLRILEPKAHQVFKHWIGAANGGRGLSPVCANGNDPRAGVCPVEKEVAHLPKDSDERKQSNARRRFIVNVLDRTPYTTCPTCESRTPAVSSPSQPRVKKCFSCDADISKADFAPLNKIKILEQGPRLFNDQLNVIADMQEADLKAAITDYDITFTTQGAGREKKITAMPQQPKELTEDDFLDPETGEPQKQFDVEALIEPETSEIIGLMMQGATIDQLNAVRSGGVEVEA